MAITAAALQAELGSNPNDAQVIQFQMPIGDSQIWYIQGNMDGMGRARWVETTASDNAATQAAAVLTALLAS